MKKVAVATAVSTQLVASTPPALPKVTHGNKTIQQT